MLSAIRRLILSVIDFFHRPFSPWIDVQTFRYLASGGSNAAMNIVVYGLVYNFVLPPPTAAVPDPFITVFGFHIATHVAAFVVAFCFSFPYGFLMSRYVVFTQSSLRGRVQLFRYSLLVLVCLWLNYILIKILVEKLHFDATISNVITQAVVALFSYTTQRYFTFRVRATDPLTEEVFLEGESEAPWKE